MQLCDCASPLQNWYMIMRGRFLSVIKLFVAAEELHDQVFLNVQCCYVYYQVLVYTIA